MGHMICTALVLCPTLFSELASLLRLVVKWTSSLSLPYQLELLLTLTKGGISFVSLHSFSLQVLVASSYSAIDIM